MRGLYNFAALPDITFFFKADLEVSLNRILDGRPKLKFFEAGMDLRLSSDPYESFRIFQGRILDQYLAMSTEFHFVTIDANQRVEAQQATVRQLVNQRIDFDLFRRRSPCPCRRRSSAPTARRTKSRRTPRHEEAQKQTGGASVSATRVFTAMASRA